MSYSLSTNLRNGSVTVPTHHHEVDRSAKEHLARHARQGIGRTLLGAARFEAAAYRSIATERRFCGLSLLVVALAAGSHAALGLAWAHRGGWEPIRSVVPAILSHFALWLGLSIVGFGVGRALGSRGSFYGLVRAVGVASFPAILYAAGVVVEPVLMLMAAWLIASTFVAVRSSLGIGPTQAVATLSAGLVAGSLLAVLSTTTLLALLG